MYEKRWNRNCTEVTEPNTTGHLFQVSYTFCRDFMQLLLKDAGITEIGSTEFGRTEILVKALGRVSRKTLVIFVQK